MFSFSIKSNRLVILLCVLALLITWQLHMPEISPPACYNMIDLYREVEEITHYENLY